MEKMTPPPNYDGAPYPQNQNNASQFSKNQQPYGNPTFQSQQEQPLNYGAYDQNLSMMNQNATTYDNLLESIKNADQLFEIMKTYISKNIGKRVQVFASFTDSTKWHDTIFDGTLVSIADDFMIIKTSEGRYDLISRVYVNYISFYDN